MHDIRKVISLNIEGERHQHRFMQFLRDEQADVVFLQEVPQHLSQKIGEQLSMRLIRFDPMSYSIKPYDGIDESDSIWGMACYVRVGLSVRSATAIHYRQECAWGHPEIKKFDDQADRMIQVVVVEGEEEPACLLQTHFTWTYDGLPDERQERDICLVMHALKTIPQFALFGDFNVPRSRNNIWDRVSVAYKDNIPSFIDSTLDEQLHRVGHLPRLVDMCFTTPAYKVDAIEVISGLSDHKAIVAKLIIP